MLIHGGFWKQKFDSEMEPIAEDLADAGLCGISNSNAGVLRTQVFGWKLSQTCAHGGQLALLPGIMTRSMIMGHSAGGHLALC